MQMQQSITADAHSSVATPLALFKGTFVPTLTYFSILSCNIMEEKMSLLQP